MSDWAEKLYEQRAAVCFLIDENLPRSLTAHLRDLFPGCVHVGDVDLLSAPDAQIWDYAKAFNFAILTKDRDFAGRARNEGSPPVVIQIRAGNCSVWHIVNLIRENAQKIRTGVQLGVSPVEIGATADARAQTPEVSG